MRRLMRSRNGSASLLFFGLFFLLLLLGMLVTEMGGVLEGYDCAMSVLQRSINSAVEANMDEAYRSDHILRLKVDAAKADFAAFSSADLPDKFTLTIKSVTGAASPPSLIATGTVTFPTLFSQFGIRDVTVGFTVKAENFAVDGR